MVRLCPKAVIHYPCQTWQCWKNHLCEWPTWCCLLDYERDLLVQGNMHVPNIYMKLGDPFPSARAFSNEAAAKPDMQIPDWHCTKCWCRNYLLCWLELYQLVNPAINAELQFLPVWGWHCPLLCLCSPVTLALLSLMPLGERDVSPW